MGVVLQYYLNYHKPHLFYTFPSEGLNRTSACRECFFITINIRFSILKDLMGSSSTLNTKMALSHHEEKKDQTTSTHTNIVLSCQKCIIMISNVIALIHQKVLFVKEMRPTWFNKGMNGTSCHHMLYLHSKYCIKVLLAVT